MPRSSSSHSPRASHRRSRSRRRHSPSPSRSRSRSRARTSTKHSSSARSKSSDSHSDKKGAVLKTSLVFLGSIAAATYAAHKFWPKGVIHGEREDWEVAHEVKHVHRRRARSRDEYRDENRRERSRWEEDEDDRDIPGLISGGREWRRRGEIDDARDSGAMVETRRGRWQDRDDYDRAGGSRSSRIVEEEWRAPRPRLEMRRDDRPYGDERPRQLEYDQGHVHERPRARRSSADWERDRDQRW